MRGQDRPFFSAEYMRGTYFLQRTASHAPRKVICFEWLPISAAFHARSIDFRRPFHYFTSNCQRKAALGGGNDCSQLDPIFSDVPVDVGGACCFDRSTTGQGPVAG
jgi:hypothetical protein